MPSTRVLICEDTFVDQCESLAALREIGVEGAKVVGTVNDAVQDLSAIERGERPHLKLIVLDLDFGRESGFEVLRVWRASDRLQKIPVVVWTSVEEPSFKTICDHFGVNSVVMKYQGRKALQDAVNTAISRSRPH